MCMSTSSSLQLLMIKAGKEHSSTASNMDQLLEQCPGNARVVVNAQAGIGKNTVLRHITRSWLEGTSQYS